MANTVLGKVSCVPRGNYSASATYYALDIVGYQGGSYLAMQEVTGVTPSNDQTNWMQLSVPGLPGGQGPQGEPGAAAGFGTVTATADNTSSTSPSVDVQASGPDTAKNFAFAFSGLKGNPGETPDITIGTVTTLDPGQDATAEITGTTPDLVLSLGLPKGQPGTSVSRIQRTDGTGAAGTMDTYTMYDSNDDAIGTFTVYNGQNGTGAGDFMANGTVPMTGALNMGGNKVTGMADPTADTDGATKGYVDEAISGVTITTDATPTQGSTNPVQSGGVYTALAGKQNVLSGTEDQLVGFNSAGEAVAVEAPNPFPSGGTTGQVLTKTETGQEWADAPDGLPDGGTEGQVLTKTSTGAQWDDVPSDLPAGGTDGQVLTKTTDGTAWADAPSGLPEGGTDGQVLTVGTDGPEWADVPSELPAGGTAGQVLAKTDDGTEWADPAESETQTVTLLSTGWTQSGDRYSQTVNCSIVAADTPVVVVDVALSGTDLDADNEALSAWAGPSACNVVQGAGTLTFYSIEAPTVNIPVNVGVG